MSLESGSSDAQRRLVDHLAEGVVWHAADGRIVDANAAAPAILGLTRDELLGRRSVDPRWEAVHEDGSAWPGDQHPAMLALRTGVPQRNAVMGITAPGQGRRWICVNAMPLPGDPGVAGGVVASFIDITEALQLRRRLQVTATELADLYHHAPCGYHSLDSQGRFQMVNDTELAWLGCARDDVIGKLGPRDFFDDAGRQAFAEAFARIQRGEAVEGVEVGLTGRQGQTRHLRVSASPIFDADGRVVSTRSVMHDITELHQTRLRLERSNAELSATLAQSLVGIARSRARVLVWKNAAFDRLFGFEDEDLTGRSVSVLYPDQAAFEALGRQAYPVLEAGGVFRGQIALRRRDGREVWVDCSAVTVDARTQETLWFSTDITALRDAEALRTQAARLEAENRQLAEVARIERLFLANVSHELRTPLNAVIGLAEVMVRRGAAIEAEKQRRYLQQILAGGRHLLGLIEAILQMADDEKGKLLLRPEPLEPAAVLAEALALVEPKARERGIVILCEQAPGVGPVLLDPLRLRQVLVNLVDNAVKFSRGGDLVTVRLRAPGPGWLEIDVEDRGIGIPEEEQERLFRRFDPLGGGLQKTHAGLGIGLAIVKQIVDAQGGSVAVRSRPGQGSLFTVRLPAEAAPPP